MTVITGHGRGLEFAVQQPSPAGHSWPPNVQPVSRDARPLTPTEALASFSLPPGYRIELVASEPLVQDPVAMDWDAEGRLWVVEMPGYMRDIAGGNEHDPIGRVVVLQDRDGDGKMDTRTVFADGLVLPRAVKVLDHGVLVGEPPNLWLMRDTNGDLHADTKTLVTNDFGQLDLDPQNNANGLSWALDNWMHLAGQADILLRLKHGTFEVERTLPRGQWGVTQDDAGRLYRNSNESALHVDIVPTEYFARNPNMLRTRGSYERLADENPDLNTVSPAHATPGTNRGYQFGILRADGSLARFTSACAPLVYRGDRLPAALQGNVFVAEPAANLVSRIVIDDDGRTLRAHKAYERGEFLASTDERFRPVYLSNAPDGTLYIVDMYRGILEHRLSMTEYLRDQILARRLQQPLGMGRIYRVVSETTRRDTSPPLSKASPLELVQALSHPNGWWRDTAQRLLVERFGSGSAQSSIRAADAPPLMSAPDTRPPMSAADASAVVEALNALAEHAPDWRTRLQALWTLDGIDATEPALVGRALEDPSRDVRAAAIRLAERWLGEAPDPLPPHRAQNARWGPRLGETAYHLREAVLKRLKDDDWAVRRQLAASLGALPATVRDAAAASLLDAYGDDPIAVDAALSGLRGEEAAVLDLLMQKGTAQTPQREAAIAMLAATTVRGAQESPVQGLFAWLADGNRVPWQRAALIRGMEIALLGASMPGTPEPGATLAASEPRTTPAASDARATPAAPEPRPTPAAVASNDAGETQRQAAPCPTCPGGRAGPGGAYAWPRPALPPGGGRAGRAAASLRLNREPLALTSLAAGGDDLARRMTRLLVRISWPGKPGDSTRVPPLTADEQLRFDRGREMYRNLCQACHQADGRGQDRRAPSLVGSTLLLARPDIPARILLNGKEGAIGLMPPIGATIDDQSIANILTYVRREWGQTGTPVDAATIRVLRTSTAGRTRPWTDAELMKLPGAPLR